MLLPVSAKVERENGTGTHTLFFCCFAFFFPLGEFFFFLHVGGAAAVHADTLFKTQLILLIQGTELTAEITVKMLGLRTVLIGEFTNTPCSVMRETGTFQSLVIFLAASLFILRFSLNFPINTALLQLG